MGESMGSPEVGIGQGVFGITTTRTPEAPPVKRHYLDEERTPVSPSSPPEELKKKSWIKSKIARFGMSLLALGGIAGGIEASRGFSDIPGIHQSADQNAKIPSTYDKKVDIQLVKAGINATPISEEEFPSLLKDTIKPLEKGKFPDVTILLPIKLDNDQIINIKTDWVNQAWNPIEQKPDRLAYGKKIIIAQKGAEIIVPTGNAEVSIATRTIEGGQYISNFGVYFYGPDGIRYSLAINSSQDLRWLEPTDLIKNALAEGKNKLALPINTSIAVTTADNVELDLTMFAYPTEYPKAIPTNFDFAGKQENGRHLIAFVPQQHP